MRFTIQPDIKLRITKETTNYINKILGKSKNFWNVIKKTRGNDVIWFKDMRFKYYLSTFSFINNIMNKLLNKDIIWYDPTFHKTHFI